MKIKHALILVLLTFCGCSQNNEQPAHIRFGDFLFGNDATTITLESRNGDSKNYNVSYAQITQYNNVKPGEYTIKVTSDGKQVLNKKYGLARDKYYTIYAYGQPEYSEEVNQKTTSTKLHHIVSGEDAATENGGLPQLKVMDDSFQGGKGETQIRWLHVAPLAEAISAEAKNIQKDKKQSLSSLKYGKTAQVISLKSGSYDVKWKLKGSPLQVAHLKKEFRADSLYTLFVSPQKGKYADSLQVIVGASH